MRFFIFVLLGACANVELVCAPGTIEDAICVPDAEEYVVEALSCSDYREHGDQVLHPDEAEVTCAQSPGRDCCICAVDVPRSCSGDAND